MKLLLNDEVAAADVAASVSASADCLKFIMIIIVRCALIAATTAAGGAERESERDSNNNNIVHLHLASLKSTAKTFAPFASFQ